MLGADCDLDNTPSTSENRRRLRSWSEKVNNSADLYQLKVKELAQIARGLRVSNWHDLKKEELVQAILAQRALQQKGQLDTSRRMSAPKRSNLESPPVSVPLTPTLSKTLSKTKHQKTGVESSSPTARSSNSTLSGPSTLEKGKSKRLQSESTGKKIGKEGLPKEELPVEVVKKEIGRRTIERKSGNSGTTPVVRSTSNATVSPTSTTTASPTTTPTTKQPGQKRDVDLNRLQEKFSKVRALSGVYDDSDGTNRDRFVLLVRDSFWLHVYWELRARLVERAKAAMGHTWHTAFPILRLFKIVADGVNNPRREQIRDIRIHNGVNNWYVDVQDPPGTFQVEIGFLSRDGHFFPIASSNIVQTPESQVVSGTTHIDGHWGSVQEDFDRIYKMSGGMKENNEQLKRVFEEQLRRSMSLPLISRFGSRNLGTERTRRNFGFKVEADVVIYGTTDPSVQLSIKGEPVRIANDGTFSVRYPIAEKRQVFPVDAKSRDGIETQQVILAIERNTKVLETVFLDNEDED
ncbi:MAG: DUF4912 domain-containing protein [Thermoguttaceae bacterium]